MTDTKITGFAELTAPLTTDLMLVIDDPAGSPVAKKMTLANLQTLLIETITPAGSILAYGGGAAPSGYLECNGSAVSRTTYSGLFTAISDAYGNGDGSTTFNLPDLRGRFIRGFDNSAGNDPDAASRIAMDAKGGDTGDAIGSYQADVFASHSHKYASTNQQYAAGSNAARLTGNSLYDTSASGGNETRPVNLYCMYIIKT